MIKANATDRYVSEGDEDEEVDDDDDDEEVDEEGEPEEEENGVKRESPRFPVRSPFLKRRNFVE